MSNRDCCQTSMVGYMGLRKFCKMLSTLICILAINVLFFVNALVVCKIVISLSLNVFVCMSSTELKLFLFQFLISVSLIRNLCIRSLKNSKTNRACWRSENRLCMSDPKLSWNVRHAFLIAKMWILVEYYVEVLTLVTSQCALAFATFPNLLNALI